MQFIARNANAKGWTAGRVHRSALAVAALAIALLAGWKWPTDSWGSIGPNFSNHTEERAPLLADDSVLGDLIRLQRDQGLTIAWYEHDLNVVLFDKRSANAEVKLPVLNANFSGAISLDGTLVAGRIWNRSGGLGLAVVRSDGQDAKEYPEVSPMDFCWSHDNRSMALTNGHFNASKLLTLNVDTRATRVIQENVENRWHFTSQCWSPDDQQVVYEDAGTTRIYDLKGNTITILTNGKVPTWSPDGQWIAFRDGDAYYAIRPSGLERKRLFKKKDATSGLFWSPDSRFVAYVKEGNFFEQFPIIDAEVYMLRVRRLEDGSEDWVSKGVSCCINYQWVESTELLSLVKSRAVK
jgi:hypothetical protein